MPNVPNYEVRIESLSENNQKRLDTLSRLDDNVNETHIQNAVDAKLFPEEVFAYECYLELAKVIPKAVNSDQYSKFNISDDLSKLLTGRYVDEKNKSLCYKFAGNWFVLTAMYPGSYGDRPIIYSNVTNLTELGELCSQFFNFERGDWRIMKTLFRLYGKRALYHNEQFRYVTRHIHPDDFEKLVPIFKTPEATFYTDLEDVKKMSDTFGEQKGCWSFEMPDAVSLYIRSDSKNAVCLMMDKSKMELTVEGEDVMQRGFNNFMVDTLGRPLNDFERKVFGLMFSGEFTVNRTIKAEIENSSE